MGASDEPILAPDPFSVPEPYDGGPRLSPLASPAERNALLDELRGLIQSGDYHVDPEVVAVAVMRQGRWESL